VTLHQATHIALFIDADNVGSVESIEPLLQTLEPRHSILIKRAYGDWFADNLRHWKDFLAQYEIEPIHSLPTPLSGKNATDIRLVIDAMDLLHNPDIQGFCIISGDRDFVPLVRRLKQSSKYLIGAGRKNTPTLLRQSYDEFHWVIETPKAGTNTSTNLAANLQQTQKQQTQKQQAQKQANKGTTSHLTVVASSGSTEKTQQSKKASASAIAQKDAQTAKPYAKELRKITSEAFTQVNAENGWVTLKQIEQKINSECKKVLSQDFSCKLFGCTGLVALIDQIGIFEWDPQQGEKIATKKRRLRLRKAA
jgi:hypothetical protein